MELERCNLKNLNEEEVKNQNQVTITNKFADLEYLEHDGNIDKAWGTIRQNIKLSDKKSLGNCKWKPHKTWCDEECSKFVERRKQAKLQNSRDASEVNEDKLNNVRQSQYIFQKQEEGKF